MSDFYSKLGATQNNVSITENGAVGYKTTSHALADFNFKVSSYRNNNSGAADFSKVLNEKEAYALKYLMYLRDAREGIGERDLFRDCLRTLANSNVADLNEIMTSMINTWIPEYGRYDDMFVLMGTRFEPKVVAFVKNQLAEDFKNYQAGKSVSLLAKWMPSENASSQETIALARTFIKALKTTPKAYRKTLSTLRGYLDVIEVKLCANEWDKVDYNAVPSKANVKYNPAFLAHDEERRRQYLNDLVRGVDKDGNVVKINSKVNFPHDIIHMYTKNSGWYGISLGAYDEAVEQLWKNLKQMDGLKDTIVVRDDSGSMTNTISGTSISAYEVATALGIYCAEHNSEAYRNKIITFSATPRYLDFSDSRKYGSLHSKYRFLMEHSEVANTNVEAVFDLILATAVENKLDASELPAQILILSDMEFDSCTYTRRGHVDVSLFSNIAAKYAQYGYKLPKLVFWNLMSRTGTIPCKQNDAGVLLVSGFSQNVLSLVNGGKVDPYDALIDELNKNRYAEVPLVSYKEARASNTNRNSTGRKYTRKESKANHAEKDEMPSFLQ